jgi:hypothetical protein
MQCFCSIDERYRASLKLISPPTVLRHAHLCFFMLRYSCLVSPTNVANPTTGHRQPVIGFRSVGRNVKK